MRLADEKEAMEAFAKQLRKEREEVPEGINGTPSHVFDMSLGVPERE